MQIMGIVNVTPDSFSDGGQFANTEQAVEHSLQLVNDGADIVDIGGESTRPGAIAITVSEELDRVLPVIEGVRKHNPTVTISIDTYKSEVAQAALDAGATMVNDVSAGRFDDAMFPLVRKRAIPYILMHMQGMPRTMQQDPSYTNVADEVVHFLRERCDLLGQTGAPVYVDPGIGFGKTTTHNLTLLNTLHAVASVAPVVLGFSRKRFITDIAKVQAVTDRDRVTILLHALLYNAPVSICRVHNVKALRELYDVAMALYG